MSIKGYVWNLFAFPEGYFEEHTAKELKVTEEERQELIKLQKQDKPKTKKK